jgi:hypothetical protein
MPIHRTDLFALIALAWQPIVVLLLLCGIAGDVDDILARFCGIPWNKHVVAKFLLTILLLEMPLPVFAAYWFRRRRR